MLDDGRSAETSWEPSESAQIGLGLKMSDVRRERRIAADMAESLVDVFGNGAKALVLSQNPERDVSRRNRVKWRELLYYVVRELDERNFQRTD